MDPPVSLSTYIYIFSYVVIRRLLRQVLAVKILVSSLEGCEQDYELEKEIGSGAFATVFSAVERWAPAGSSKVAIKRISRRGLSEKDVEDVHREVRDTRRR